MIDARLRKVENKLGVERQPIVITIVDFRAAHFHLNAMRPALLFDL